MALFVTGALAFAVDLAAKQLVLRLHQERVILPSPLVRIRVLMNTAGALGHVISAPALVLLRAATVTGYW